MYLMYSDLRMKIKMRANLIKKKKNNLWKHSHWKKILENRNYIELVTLQCSAPKSRS